MISYRYSEDGWHPSFTAAELMVTEQLLKATTFIYLAKIPAPVL